MEKQKLLIITGSTASGKTSCAVHAALMLGGEVISADSMQIYCGMDVLTAMPREEEMCGVAHHMLAIAPPSEKYSVAEYRRRALLVIADIAARGKMPVVCGGTGLYINALARPMSFSAQGDEKIRGELAEISAEPSGKEKLHAMLREIDPDSARRLHPNDVRRVIRAIEIYRITGRTQTEQSAIDAAMEGTFDERIFALNWPRDELYRRIEARVDQMIAAGLIDEVDRLMRDPDAHLTAGQAIGYKEIAAALRGECTVGEAVAQLKQATRNYAKRQMTWLRGDQRVKWIDAGTKPSAEVAREIVEIFLQGE